MTDKIDIVLNTLSDTKRDLREDISKIFDKLDSLPCSLHEERINQLKESNKKKVAFFLGLPSLLLTILSLILIIKNWG